MFKNHLTIAFRNLKRNKVFSFINMLGLSIGISACLVIWLIVSFEFSFDTFHPDKERIYRVVSDFTFSGEAFYNAGVSGPMPKAVREEFTGLESVSALHQVNMKAMIADRKGNVKTFDETKQLLLTLNISKFLSTNGWKETQKRRSTSHLKWYLRRKKPVNISEMKALKR